MFPLCKLLFQAFLRVSPADQPIVNKAVFYIQTYLCSQAVSSTMILKTRNTVIPWRLEGNLSSPLLYFCEAELTCLFLNADILLYLRQ